MADVVLTNVTKVFGGGRFRVVAVEGLSLSVRDDEFLAVVGPSGSGKTTLLRLIAGLEAPTDGKIAIGGRVVNDVAPKDRDVAMVFQGFALYPHMSVRENLAFGLRMRKTPGDEVRRRVAEVADLLGIGEILDRRPGTLSGGQQQRVALGRAMVRRPSVYLFDEPLASLDAPLRARTRVELKRMKRSVPMSGLYVTHDQQEAMSLGDRIAVMKDGRLRQLGSPREVYDSPADRFVAGFFGATSMNFLEGSLRQSGGETTLEGRGWRLLAPSSLLDRIRTGLDDGVGRSVVLGVRPEDVRIRTNGGDGGAFGVSAALEMTETLGGSELAYLRLEDGQRIVAFASLEGLNGLGASSGTAGDSVRVDVEMRRAAFFEPGPSGVNLTRTSES